ncbi:glycosyltransferase family 2 protein [Telmatobacter bradus]|uniref:glycosyltransferase family 2 protein n=1 Tax=Telmatobacter bradus TaxID=474953 RepID=UPI003B4368E8
MMRTGPYAFTASILIVSYNTRELLRRCLLAVEEECARLPAEESAEIVVVDNASADGSAAMVEAEFAGRVRLIDGGANLGFGVANNLAIEAAQGEFLVLLNSDAFFHPGALARAIAHMRAEPHAGAGGARLVAEDGSGQPSARAFPSLCGEALILFNLSQRFGHTRLFGWADPAVAAPVDWVTGAFMILRREALAASGLFDPRFFLFSEEVDLCRCIHQAGYGVYYWPDVVVTHLGGGSSSDAPGANAFNPRIELWQLRSMLLYFGKHHGGKARLVFWLFLFFYALRFWRNRLSRALPRKARAQQAGSMIRLLRQAWRETSGGRVSPPQPW